MGGASSHTPPADQRNTSLALVRDAVDYSRPPSARRRLGDAAHVATRAGPAHQYHAQCPDNAVPLTPGKDIA